MPDESQVAASTPATTAEPATPVPDAESSEQSADRSERVRSWMNQAIRSGRAPTAPASQTEKPDASQPTDDKGRADPGADAAAQREREIQAEVDRREAKRNRDAQAAQRRAQEVALRNNNPTEYARFKEAEEQQQSSQAQETERLRAAAESVTQTYDKLVLDPLFGALPKKDQNEILREHSALVGFESRAAIAKDALARIVKNARAEGAKEAETRLRSNPAFTKQLMTELRGERDEPEIVSGTTASPANTGMNEWIRAAAGRRVR